jgi:hypothetical protein
MADILRNWNRLNRPDRIDLGQSVVDKITAGGTAVAATHADFVAFAAKQAAAKAALATIKALEDQLKVARPAAETALDDWAAALEQLAKTGDSAAKGSAADIAAMGFQPSSNAPPASPQPLTQVQGLVVTAGDSDGELDYTHERTNGATSYERQTTTTPTDEASWVSRETITRSSGTVGGLPSGSRQWLRVRAIGPMGPGPWSDPATKTVP